MAINFAFYVILLVPFFSQDYKKWMSCQLYYNGEQVFEEDC